MMDADSLPENVPDWLQKDIVSTRHEVPIADGRSRTVWENHYTTRVVRWALEEWLRHVPADGDVNALRQALPIALADSQAFHAYLRLPDAFGETYLEELAKLNARRAELSELKRVLKRGPRPRSAEGHFTAWLLIACAIALLALLW